MNNDWLKTQFDLNPGKSKADLANALGLDAPAVSKILNGSRQIKASEYITMRRFFGLPVEDYKSLAQKHSDRSYVLNSLNEMAEEKADDPWVMPASMFEGRTKAAPENIRIFTVQGNAMAPEFLAGEKVLVDLSDIKPSPPGVFVVSDGIGQILRQCESVPQGKQPTVKLSAHNSKYETYTMLLDEADIIGRVIAKLQWL